MKTPQPVCKALRPWLKANLGKGCLGALTGTDAKALDTAVHLIELYAYDPAPELLPAFAAIVRQMQPCTRYLAFHAIAHIRDWNDRFTMWGDAGLDLPIRLEKCAYEPGGVCRSLAA
jgi:hypothetical protein